MDDEEDPEVLELSDEKTESILTNQVSMYQHFQKVSTNLLNIFIGAFTLVVTAFGTGYLELPQISVTSVENATFYTTVDDGTLGAIKISGYATSGLTLTIILLLILSTLISLSSILWPEDLKPLFGSEEDTLSIVNVSDAYMFETYLKSNRAILQEMSEKQSRGYKSLGIGAATAVMLLYLIGSLVEGNYNTMMTIYLIIVLPPLLYLYGKSPIKIISILRKSISFISLSKIKIVYSSLAEWTMRNIRNWRWFDRRTYLICAVLGVGIKISNIISKIPLTQITSMYEGVNYWYQNLPFHPLLKQFIVILAGSTYVIMCIIVGQVAIEIIHTNLY